MQIALRPTGLAGTVFVETGKAATSGQHTWTRYIPCEAGCPGPADYERDRANGYAGPVSTLHPSLVVTWAATAHGWDGKHWAMRLELGVGTVLGPVNVSD